MNRAKWVLLLFLLLPSSAMADVIVYGNNFSFGVTEPKGWIADTESGKDQKVNVVLYEKGTTWADAPVVMYVNVTGKKNDKLSDLISYDTSNFKSSCPGINISRMPIERKDGHIESMIFDCPTQNYEVVSYLEVKDKFCILVMTGRSKRLVEEKLPAFKEFVEGFTWLTSNVRFK